MNQLDNIKYNLSENYREIKNKENNHFGWRKENEKIRRKVN